MGGVHEDFGAVVEAMAKDTIIDGIIIFLLVMALVGFIEAQWPDEPETESICAFPCEFQGPVYKLPVKSAKYEYLKTIKRKGG
uniref:Uncharacterized protein n=1 Tax=viral metagenome TaxID=1070528 RepID=A0A6M3LHF1_9ZZZZ